MQLALKVVDEGSVFLLTSQLKVLMPDDLNVFYLLHLFSMVIHVKDRFSIGQLLEEFVSYLVLN